MLGGVDRLSSFVPLSSSLVERERELGRLEAVLRATQEGAGVTVVIEGPAGIGKTSLLAIAKERAAVGGMTILQARGSILEREYGMGVARQCFDPILRTRPDREELLQGAARLAESVLLEAPDELTPAPVGVLHGLYWLSANLADRAPLLVVVDDAHWADEPSLRFLAYLARRVESLRVALVIATRSDEAGAWADPLTELRSDPSTEVVQPGPLPPAGVEAFLHSLSAGPVEHGFARACHEATGGNPFLLGELARSLQAEDVPFTAAGVPRVAETTPPTVARAVRARLEPLGEGSKALALAVSTLGDEVELDLAADLVELSMGHAAAAADKLARVGILVDATPLRFYHPLVAAAVRVGLTAAERVAAHARAAELLRARGAGPERVALQLMHAPPVGDQAVVGDLRAAAERARARGAPSTAAALLRRAIAEPPAMAQRAVVLCELADAEYAAGGNRDAYAHFEEAHRAAADASTRGRALLGLFHTGLGTHAEWREVTALAERTLPEVAAHDRELALRLQAISLLTGAGTQAGQTRIIRESRALSGATPGEAIVLGHLAEARVGTGASAAEIGDIAERAARQADALVEEGATQLVLTGIMLPLRWADRLDAAQDLLDRAAAIAQRRGSTIEFASVLCERSLVHRRAGRLIEAEADARSAIAAAGDPGVVRRNALTPLLACLVEQGRVADAARELAAHHAGEEIRDAPALTALLLERMRLRTARGDHQRALADWKEAVRRADRLRGLNPGWIPDIVAAAEVHHALGLQEAQDLTAKALDLARQWDTSSSMGEALHARARLAGGDDSIDMLRKAVELLEQSPARLVLARALVTLGGRLRRAGHRAESRMPLREGYELARQCAALALAETARAELRSSGVRLRREALSGIDALTASERRIADMAAAGASNPEIAQALFLTVKTVEMHLTRAYRKLDIGRRSELPDALAGNL